VINEYFLGNVPFKGTPRSGDVQLPTTPSVHFTSKKEFFGFGPDLNSMVMDSAVVFVTFGFCTAKNKREESSSAQNTHMWVVSGSCTTRHTAETMWGEGQRPPHSNFGSAQRASAASLTIANARAHSSIHALALVYGIMNI